jgi:hypothetical protein
LPRNKAWRARHLQENQTRRQKTALGRKMQDFVVRGQLLPGFLPVGALLFEPHHSVYSVFSAGKSGREWSPRNTLNTRKESLQTRIRHFLAIGARAIAHECSFLPDHFASFVFFVVKSR